MEEEGGGGDIDLSVSHIEKIIFMKYLLISRAVNITKIIKNIQKIPKIEIKYKSITNSVDVLNETIYYVISALQMGIFRHHIYSQEWHQTREQYKILTA